MLAKLTATLFQIFVIYILWAYADVTTNPFILRALALVVMVFQIVAVVRVWVKN
jgi:hypothetical protein